MSTETPEQACLRYMAVLNDLANTQLKNNPNDEPVGDCTGRCYKCGSKDLWDDNLHYGCNHCGMLRLSRL